MAELIAGTCYVKVDGQVLLLKGSMTATASNVSREAIVANGRVSGYKEFVVDKNFPVAKLQTGADMTVVAEFANGWTYTLGGAFVTDSIEVSGDDSDTTINFAGETGKWSI